MSLRETYTATSSPTSSAASSPASSPTSSDYAPYPLPARPSPSRITHQTHRDQLASYKGRKNRTPTVWSALDAVRNAWKVSLHALSLLLGVIRSRSIRIRRSRLSRWLLCLVAIMCLCCIHLRLAFHRGHISTPPSSSTRYLQDPLFIQVRHVEHLVANNRARAPLPASVLSHASGNHTIEGGLLKVDMKSKIHPVYQLIRDARQVWDDKLDRQSRSLLEAVKEYRRRYGRAPPKGFDRWWKYVVENNVTLPDEYDQINRDLLPFRSLSGVDLNRRVYRASRLPDTYTLEVKNGSLRASVAFEENKIYGSKERVEGQEDLIEPISHELEDFKAVYWVHDTPSVLISHGHRRELREYLDEEEYFDENEEIDLSLRGWPAMCPAQSSMGIKGPRIPDAFDLSKGTRHSYTFIANHYLSMDLCEHPELVSLHGLLLGKNPQVAPLTPLFVLSKTALHADILGVPVEQIVRNIQDVPWEEKFEDRLLWRGSNTGTRFSRETTWRDTHRTRLIKLVNEHMGKVDMLSPPREMDGKILGEGRRQVPIEVANRYYHDMAFTGEPIQCIVSEGTCEELAAEYRFTDLMTHEAALYYKYVIDVDGNAWSARFQRLLAAGSLIFKTTIFPEWWTDRIQPWVHYVPIQVDYSDLYDVIAFFRGDTAGRGGEPSLAKEIAETGKEWADTNWRPVEMTAYVFRLYLEWARLLAPKRREMDFVYDERMEKMVQ